MQIKPKTKLKALGCKKVSNIDPQILNEQSVLIFQDPHPQNVRKSHGAQFFENFVEEVQVKQDKAKWQEDKFLVLIQIDPIQTEEFDINLITSAFEAFYLNMNIILLQESLTLLKEKDEFFLINNTYNIKEPIKSFENADGEKINLSSSQIIRTQRLLLKLFLKNNNPSISGCQLTSQNLFSSISFIDHPIVLECVPDNIITGRAQGYQGAVIGMKDCVQREIITTALHECLHVLSIHHCIWWDCIMNFSYEYSNNFSSGGSIHLCPSCLSKVKYQLDFDILERYRRLCRFFTLCGYTDDLKFIQSIMKTF
ncbi:hypothetical protein ABPG74_009144 [Tetrahymena malaccensis]